MSNAKSVQLRKQLIKVQARGGTVWSDFRKSNLEMYKHIAEIYLWWLGASKQKDFLTDEYAKLRMPFRQTTQLINYIPLFWLVWGTANCDKSTASRHSKALNKVNEEYVRKPKYYAKDGVYKLAKFIETNNGIDGLSGYKKTDADQSDTTAADNGDDFYEEEHKLQKLRYVEFLKANSHKSILTPAEENIVVYEEAKTFYAAQPTQPVVDFGSELAVNDDALSLILVRKTAAGYELLGSTNDAELVRAVTVTNFKHNLNALPQEIKCVLETLRSQALPQSLSKFARDLVDWTGGKNTKPQYKRLIFRVGSGDFLLSPVNAKSGVVSVVKPHVDNFYTGTGDIYLSTLSTKLVEKNLIAKYAFNLYKLDGIECYDFGVEKLFRLQNQFNYSDFLHLDFWRFEHNELLPVNQADVAVDALDKVHWETTLDIGFFRQLTLQVLDKWFVTHGKMIKRERGQTCQITFEQTRIVIEFVLVNGVFEVAREIALTVPTSSLSKTTLQFKTKDIMPVLRAIADFNINSISAKANSDVLQFEFANDTAVYSISIPTINSKGIRNNKAFTNYKAVVSEQEPQSVDDFDYAVDAIVE